VRRVVTRLLGLLTGGAMLVVYLLAALLLVDVARLVWQHRPDPATLLAVVLGTALLTGYLSYRLGTARLLAALDAETLPSERAPDLHRRVADLADAAGVDPPRLAVTRLGFPNALALGGRSGGVVVLDVSLFRLLSAAELEAVVAHELAHLAARDTLVKTLGYAVVDTLGGLLSVLLLPFVVVVGGLARALAHIRGGTSADGARTAARARAAVGALAVVLLFALTLLLRAHSRRREYAADERAATLTGRPLALARALDRMRRATVPSGPLSRFYIHGDEDGTLSRLFATHPPMDERIERLRDLAEERSVRVAVE
jgi:heat shock protein HtpX